MATASERRKQKARQKHKVRRERAQAARKDRAERNKAVKASPAGSAASWPLGDAYLSANWHDWEATVHGVISRVHDSGKATFVCFTVDLAEQGLTELTVYANLPENQIAAWAGTKADEHAMFTAEPTAVARLLHDGVSLRRDTGAADLPDLSRALDLFSDVDPDESPFDYHHGYEDDDEPTVEVRRGILDRIKGVFGG